MNLKEKIEKLSNSAGVSGYESDIAGITEGYFKEFCEETYTDKLGSVVGVKRGSGSGKKVMLMAHIDEIGFMVSNADKNGLLQFSTIGGFDPRTLLYQDVVLHGERKLNGVIVPEKFSLEEQDRSKAIPIEDLRIDIGAKSKEEALSIVEIGTTATVDRELLTLEGNHISGKAMDDRACVGVLLECGSELLKYNHQLDVYFVGSVQEEVGTRGAVTSAYEIAPEIGIAVDVTFGHTSDLSDEETIEMGKGSGITIGGNMHRGIREKMIEIAKKHNIPYQLEVSPGQTGTDARSIQITKAGIPTLLLAVPLRYMHTSIEVVNMNDVESSGRLLARFIAEICEGELEELTCC